MKVPTVDQRMKAAREAIAKLDWHVAKFETQWVISDESGNADAHNLLAYAYRKQERPDRILAFERYQIGLQALHVDRSRHEHGDRRPTAMGQGVFAGLFSDSPPSCSSVSQEIR
jgi:hypothetical protein